jgi:hypothetical protein
MSSSSALVPIKLQTPQGPLELRLYDHHHQLVKRSFGSVELNGAPGLYRLEIDAGSTTEEHYLTVGPSGLRNLGLTVAMPSAAPVAGTSTVHEYHAFPAQDLSNKPSGSFGQGGRLMIFVRSMEGDQRSPVNVQPLSLVDARQNVLVGSGGSAFVEQPSDGWAGFSADVDPGGYAVRLRRRQRSHQSLSDEETIDQSVWVEQGWTTLVFIPYRQLVGWPEPEFASIHMARISEGFRPYEQDSQGASLALEVALSGLRQGRAVVPQQLVDLMLQRKFINPMLGIVGALVLLQSEVTNWRLFNTVRANLQKLVPHHPDLDALHVMAKRKRDDDSESRIPAAAWPPMLYACYRGIIDSDNQERRRIVAADSVADLAASRLLAQGPWTQWRAFDAVESVQRHLELNLQLSQILQGVWAVTQKPVTGRSLDTSLRTAWENAISKAEAPAPSSVKRRPSASGATAPAAGFEPAARTVGSAGEATPEELRVASYLQTFAAQAAQFDLPVEESAFEVRNLSGRVGLPRATVQRALKGLASKGLVPGLSHGQDAQGAQLLLASDAPAAAEAAKKPTEPAKAKPEQFNLLRDFVEGPRGEYFVTWPHEDPQATFIHVGTNHRFEGQESDAEMLVSLGFLHRPGGKNYSVTPKGMDHYNRVLAKRE